MGQRIHDPNNLMRLRVLIQHVRCLSCTQPNQVRSPEGIPYESLSLLRVIPEHRDRSKPRAEVAQPSSPLPPLQIYLGFLESDLRWEMWTILLLSISAPLSSLHFSHGKLYVWHESCQGKSHLKSFRVSLVHTVAIEAPFPVSTAGAICPREVFGLADQQPAGSACTPQGCAHTFCIWAVLGLISKRELALPVGIIQSPRKVRRKLHGVLGLVHQTFACQ